MPKNRTAKMFLKFGITACIMSVYCLTVMAESTEKSATEKFPETYEKDGDQVYFSCTLNLPQDFDESSIQKVEVEQVQCSDYEKVTAYQSGDIIPLMIILRWEPVEPHFLRRQTVSIIPMLLGDYQKYKME